VFGWLAKLGPWTLFEGFMLRRVGWMLAVDWALPRGVPVSHCVCALLMMTMAALDKPHFGRRSSGGWVEGIPRHELARDRTQLGFAVCLANVMEPVAPHCKVPHPRWPADATNHLFQTGASPIVWLWTGRF